MTDKEQTLTLLTPALKQAREDFKKKKVAELMKYSHFGPCMVCGEPIKIRVGTYAYFHKECRSKRKKLKHEKKIISFKNEGMGKKHKEEEKEITKATEKE